MKPDRSNYELWFIDWLDGNLSDPQAEELRVFLNENPDLRDEIDGIALVNLKPGENSFPGKEILRKTSGSISRGQFEHLCISYLENDINPEQRSELLEIINHDDNKKREFELTMKVKLKPPQDGYVWKKRIKKLTAGQKIIRLSVAGLSAAAAVAVVIAIYLSSPLDKTKGTVQASVYTNSDTLLIPLYPSITIKEQKPSPSEKMTLPNEPETAVADIQFPDQNIFVSEGPEQHQSDSINRFRPAIAINRVSVPSPGKINNINTPIHDANSLLAYNKAALLPSPFEEDRSNVDRFFARLFHEKIMKDKAGASPVKSFDLAVAGITGLNKLFGWQLALHKNMDATGEVKSYNFSSKLLKFNTPVKKNTDSL